MTYIENAVKIYTRNQKENRRKRNKQFVIQIHLKIKKAIKIFSDKFDLQVDANNFNFQTIDGADVLIFSHEDLNIRVNIEPDEFYEFTDRSFLNIIEVCASCDNLIIGPAVFKLLDIGAYFAKHPDNKSDFNKCLECKLRLIDHDEDEVESRLLNDLGDFIEKKIGEDF